VPTSIATPTAWWIADGRTHPSTILTSDAGKTWHAYGASRLPPVKTWQLSAADAEHAWLTTSTAQKRALYATSDGGRTWHRLSVSPP